MPSSPRSRRPKSDTPSKTNFPKINLEKLHLPKLKMPKFDINRLPKLPIRQVLIVLGLGVMALIMLNLNTRLNEYNRLTSQREKIAAEVAVLEVTHSALETQVAYARSDEAVEDYAREAHLVRTSEVLVVPLSKPGLPTPTPESKRETPRFVQNWEVWWALFFD